MNEIVEKALNQEKILKGRGYQASLARKLDVGVSTFWNYVNGFGVSEIMETKIIIGCNIVIERPETNKITQQMRAEWYLKNKHLVS